MPHEYKKPDQKEINDKKLVEISEQLETLTNMIRAIKAFDEGENLDGRKLAMVFTHVELARMYFDGARAKLNSSVESN